MLYPDIPCITLIGHLGAGPLTCFRHGFSEILHGCDDLAGKAWTRTIEQPGCQFQTGRIVDATLSTGQPLPTRCQRLFAFGDRLAPYRKGDRIEILGHFRRRAEEPTSIVEFVVWGVDFALD